MMNRRKWLAVMLVFMLLIGMLCGCGKNEPENVQAQPSQPPAVSREDWRGYPVAGLTVYLPKLFEEGSISENTAEFISQDDDFDGEYVELVVVSEIQEELQLQVTDADALSKVIQAQVEENEGVIYAAGIYWDVPYLVYAEDGAERNCCVVGLYADNDRCWAVQIDRIHPDQAVELVPYVCGGVIQSPAGWETGRESWMAYDIAGLGIRIPGELLAEADFYSDCAYFTDSQSDAEMEVMSGELDELDEEITDANSLADWFAADKASDGYDVMVRGEAGGVPYLIFGDGEDATLVGFYVSGEQYWMITAEYLTAEPEDKWISLVTGGQI